MKESDLTVVVNAHREGIIAHASLLSASRAKKHAESNGYNVDFLVVLDRPDSLTQEIVEEWAKAEGEVRIISVDYGDLGQSRNKAVSESSGEWIAFLDADDLWCETWLSESLRLSSGDQRNIVWHPEVYFYFGGDISLSLHPDMERDDDFQPSYELVENFWSALCIARRALLLEVPYIRTKLDSQIGYEDWSWNLAVMARGAVHKHVPGTCHAIRKKARSLSSQTRDNDAIPDPQCGMDWLFQARVKDAQVYPPDSDTL